MLSKERFTVFPILIFAAAVAVGLVGWWGIEKGGLRIGSVGSQAVPFMSIPEQSVDILKSGQDQNKKKLINQFFPVGEDILAQSIITVYGPKIFRLKDFPNTVFKILKVIKATGSAPPSSLGLCYVDTENSPEYDRRGFVILRLPKSFISNGAGYDLPICFDSTTTDGLISPVVFIEIEVINSGDQSLEGDYLLAFDNDVLPGRETLAVSADQQLPLVVGPMSSGTFYLSFGGLSSGQQEINLAFGNYGRWLGSLGEEMLSKSEGGFIINFTSKKISEIPG